MVFDMPWQVQVFNLATLLCIGLALWNDWNERRRERHVENTTTALLADWGCPDRC